jgi:hypothetical protein
MCYNSGARKHPIGAGNVPVTQSPDVSKSQIPNVPNTQVPSSKFQIPMSQVPMSRCLKIQTPHNPLSRCPKSRNPMSQVPMSPTSQIPNTQSPNDPLSQCFRPLPCTRPVLTAPCLTARVFAPSVADGHEVVEEFLRRENVRGTCAENHNAQSHNHTIT